MPATGTGALGAGVAFSASPDYFKAAVAQLRGVVKAPGALVRLGSDTAAPQSPRRDGRWHQVAGVRRRFRGAPWACWGAPGESGTSNGET